MLLFRLFLKAFIKRNFFTLLILFLFVLIGLFLSPFGFIDFRDYWEVLGFYIYATGPIPFLTVFDLFSNISILFFLFVFPIVTLSTLILLNYYTKDMFLVDFGLNFLNTGKRYPLFIFTTFIEMLMIIPSFLIAILIHFIICVSLKIPYVLTPKIDTFVYVFEYALFALISSFSFLYIPFTKKNITKTIKKINL